MGGPPSAPIGLTDALCATLIEFGQTPSDGYSQNADGSLGGSVLTKRTRRLTSVRGFYDTA